MSESTIKVEEGTIQTYTVRAAQRNRDGSELEGPRIFVTIKFPLERVEAHLGTLARLIKRDRVIKFLEMKFIEQLELEAIRDTTPVDPKHIKDPLGTFPKSEKNGDGRTVDDTPPRPIGDAIKKHDRAKA
jgi:hypothetical protein